jgi:phage baseplate assembly protein V
MSQYELGEMSRQIANLLRVGKITEIDDANGRVKVSTSGLTTDWLPWGAGRAGATKQWSPPSVGEQVLIASPYGDMGQAVVVASLFSDEEPAPATSKDQNTTTYPDGSTVDYNSSTNTLTVTVAAAGNVVINCKVANIVAATSVTLDTPQTTCTGALIVQGGIQFEGGMSGAGSVSIDGNLSASGSITDGDGDGGA